MKYIVIGLGYFGSSLATNLTEQGHEVIGIDHRNERVDELKDSISNVLIMDATRPNAMKSLPLQEVDAVIVAIGEDIGSSILILSILKRLNVKRIIGRAITPIHRDILNELGILEVIQPEEDSALLVASMLHINGAIKVLGLNRKNAVAEIMIPEKYVGHSLESINMETRFQLKVIALKIYPTGSRIASFLKTDCKVEFEIDLARPLRATDVLVIGGETNDIIKFIES
ncbi:MAG: TrkA family potassium uptake protein [Bacteroidales bacterium]